MNLISECYKISIEKLINNTTQDGILAASTQTLESNKKHYSSLFSRDIGVCSIGIIQSGNTQLIDSLKTSLINLASVQSDLGQFPFLYKPEKDLVHWRGPGSIDSSIWWGIAFLEYYKYLKDEIFYNKFKPNLEKLFTWLSYQDTNQDNLLEQGEASDWADEMPRRGTVLYTNCLWYWFISLLQETATNSEEKVKYQELKNKIYDSFNTILWIHKSSSSNFDYFPDNEFTKTHRYSLGGIEYLNSKIVFLPYYLGYVSHKNTEIRCDILGNILACLVNLADETKSNSITDSIKRFGGNLPYPMKAMYPAIYPGEPDWNDYMTKGRQNYPNQYHNGGIWPFIGGFWVMWLAKVDKELAYKELEKLAYANSLNNWEFNEYLHGELGTPMGIAYQSWNMGMYIAAHKSIFG